MGQTYFAAAQWSGTGILDWIIGTRFLAVVGGVPVGNVHHPADRSATVQCAVCAGGERNRVSPSKISSSTIGPNRCAYWPSPMTRPSSARDLMPSLR